MEKKPHPSQTNKYVDAFQKGVDIGKDINEARIEQRQIVAKRVKALRMERGISQDKFSDMIHANVLTYRGYENCKSDIPLFYLVRIADKLETTLDYLAGRTEAKDAVTLEQRVERLEEIVLKDSEKQ